MPIYSNLPEDFYPRPSDVDAPLRSPIGRGPRGPQGHSITAEIVDNDPYGYFRVRFKDATTGEVLVVTPNLDVGSRIFVTSEYAPLNETSIGVTHSMPSSDLTPLQASSDRSAVRVGDLIVFNAHTSDATLTTFDTFGIGVVNRVDNQRGDGTFVDYDVVHFVVTNVITGQIAPGSITTEMLADNAVTSPKIANGAVGTTELMDGSVTEAKLAGNSVTTDKLANGSVTNPKIADGSVTNPKIANGAVTSTKIVDGSVTNSKIANNSVSTEKIANSSVTSSKISDGSVNTTKLADRAVTNTKIANASITTEKIKNRSVTLEKLSEEALVIEGPTLADPIEWNGARAYDAYTVVTHNGNSYTSRANVPIGIDIEDEDYWVETGNYNAQVEQYRQEVAELSDDMISYSVESYGAVGDGITDDTAAIQSALDADIAGKRIIKFSNNKVYKTSGLTIGHSNTTLLGNGATILHESANGIGVNPNLENIVVIGLNFSGSFIAGDTSTPGNVCIGFSDNDVDTYYSTKNVTIKDCNLSCGVFGIALNSVMNASISNCNFSGCVYRPEDGAGGYAILEQSCHNVSITNCHFQMGDYGRHDIYVSVNQRKTDYKNSSNIKITNCVFDHSNMNVQASGGFYSPNTPAVMVRAVNNLLIENCYEDRGTGICAVSNDDGDIVNAHILNCVSNNPRFISSSQSAAEQRYIIAVLRNFAYMMYVKIDGLKVTNKTENIDFISCSGNLIEICNCEISGYIDTNVDPSHITDSFMSIHNCIAEGTGLRVGGSGVFYGKFYEIQSSKQGSPQFFGQTTNENVKINLGSYSDEMLKFAVTGSFIKNNSRLVYPNIVYTAPTGNNYGVFSSPYCTKPQYVKCGPMGANVRNVFNGDVTHNEWCRLYSINTDGSLAAPSNVYVEFA